MKNLAMSPARRLVLFCVLLAAPPASPQMPARPGYLHVTSKQNGEAIVVNHQQRSEPTPVTLVVSPGTYTVQIGGCVGQTKPVASGATVEFYCDQ
jgi:hypothetical protein